MARGPALTLMEKYAIRAMLEDGLTIAQVAAKTRRSESLVNKFIKNEFEQGMKAINSEVELLPRDVAEAAVKRLTESGYSLYDAHSVINRIRRKIKTAVGMGDLDQIVKWANDNPTVKEMIVTKSNGGRGGVAVMQSGASEALDKARESRKPRDTSSHIYRQQDAQ